MMWTTFHLSYQAIGAGFPDNIVSLRNPLCNTTNRHWCPVTRYGGPGQLYPTTLHQRRGGAKKGPIIIIKPTRRKYEPLIEFCLTKIDGLNVVNTLAVQSLFKATYITTKDSSNVTYEPHKPWCCEGRLQRQVLLPSYNYRFVKVGFPQRSELERSMRSTRVAKRGTQFGGLGHREWLPCASNVTKTIAVFCACSSDMKVIIQEMLLTNIETSKADA